MKRAGILALALFAAACEEQVDERQVAQGGEAAGEVLGGSISDAMIPLEQLESEAPLLPRRAAAPGDAAGEDESETQGAGASEPESEEAEAAPVAPAPAPVPDGETAPED